MDERDNPEPPEDKASELEGEWLSRVPLKGSRRSSRPRVVFSRPRKLIRCGMVLDGASPDKSRRSSRTRKRGDGLVIEGEHEDVKRSRSHLSTPPRRRDRSASVTSATTTTSISTGHLATLAQQAEEAQEQCGRCNDVMSKREGRRLGPCVCHEDTDRLRRARRYAHPRRAAAAG